MHFSRSLMGLAATLVVCSANAAVLFSQPNTTADGYFADSITYTPGATFYEQAVADNFSLGTASVVNQIVFWGGGEGFFNPGLDNVSGFQINVYDSSWTSVSTNSVTLASVTPTVTGNTNTGGGTEYQFTFNTSIALAAGNYWLHVGGVYVVPQNDAFVWSSNNAGDGQSAFADLSVNQSFAAQGNQGFDQAFELRGDAVPEPASMAVLGLGIAALAQRKRK